MSEIKQRKPRLTFTPEQRLEYAKLMVNEGYSNKKIKEISGAGDSAVTRWKRQYLAEINGETPPPGKKALTPDKQRIQELEKQLWRAQRDNEILKKATAFFVRDNSKLSLVTQVKKANPNYTLTELCSLFEIKQSTYYYQQSPRPMDNQTIQLLVNIKAIFAESDSTYGKRRIRKALQTSGFSIGIYRTASLMKKAGLKAKAPKKKHYYGDSGKVHRIAPNLLKRQFEQTTPNTHWVGDISYIRTHQGWGYLAAVLDLSSKQIVGYALSKKPNAQLAKDALSDALRKQNPNTHKLLFHSGQGVQYSAKSFVSAIRKT